MKTFNRLAALCLTAWSAAAAEIKNGLVVHEWGTFTSVQGGDGKLLLWQPFITPDLPNFVYNWRRPGLGRELPMVMAFNKGGIRSLQRMETPVIYFYSDHELTTDVTVKFPKGFITEWYPQAQHVGSYNATTFAVGTNALAVGTNLTTLSTSLESGFISWRDLQIVPAKTSDLTKQLPTDHSDNHYFAARETDSALVKLAQGGTDGTTPELEKLLFYRGTGNFTTPLQVTLTDEGFLSVSNTGAEPLADLFLVERHNGAGHWTHLENLSPGQRKPWRALTARENLTPISTEEFAKHLGAPLEKALVRAGLYPREAAAMVKTWSKSWFAEDGVRVLYILPREWTDATLPLTLNPQPKGLERVMVGRAEIIPPQIQRELAADIAKERTGDAAAIKRLQAAGRKLGRFYDPAHQLATARLKPPTTTAAVSNFD
jgi:hypothetical protein